MKPTACPMPSPAPRSEAEIRFYVGLHQPGDAVGFDHVFLSINRIRGRRKPIPCKDVVIDSGAFRELERFGAYRHSVEEYAAEIHRLHVSGVVSITAVVAQDYMCETFMLTKTGLTIKEHQRLTIERYDALLAALIRLFGVQSADDLPFHVMPVLQGYSPADYAHHVRMYGDRLKPNIWAGVGSVCKRQGDPESIVAVLCAILAVRPDLRLHGFGVKITGLMHSGVRSMLFSADSMAWSFAARKQGRDGNDPAEARTFVARVAEATSRALTPWQTVLVFERTTA